MAAVGSSSTLDSCRYTMDTVAVAPAYRPDGVPVMVTTTGNEATPELALASSPTEVTVPYCGVLEPCGRMVACSPLRIRPIWVSSTDTFTTNAEPTTTTCAVLDEDDVDELPF